MCSLVKPLVNAANLLSFVTATVNAQSSKESTEKTSRVIREEIFFYLHRSFQERDEAILLHVCKGKYLQRKIRFEAYLQLIVIFTKLGEKCRGFEKYFYVSVSRNFSFITSFNALVASSLSTICTEVLLMMPMGIIY